MRNIIVIILFVLIACSKDEWQDFSYNGFINEISFVDHPETIACLEISEDFDGQGGLLFQNYTSDGIKKESLTIKAFIIKPDTIFIGNYSTLNVLDSVDLTTARYFLTDDDALLKSYQIDSNKPDESWLLITDYNYWELRGEYQLSFIAGFPRSSKDHLRPDSLLIENGTFKAKIKRI